MKNKKTFLVTCVLCVALALCAFVVLPKVSLKSTQNDTIDVSYLSAKQNEDTLILSVNYESYGEFFEIAKDISVATDEKFSNTLTKISSTPKDNQYIYEFKLDKPTDTIFITPPILYLPVEVEPVSIALTSNNSSLTTESESWFSITSVSVNEAEEGNYYVSIIINPTNEDLPRFPKLILGKESLGGISSLNFDENDKFNFGEFIFYFSAKDIDDAYDMLEGASLVVDQALIKVSATDIGISSMTKSLNVIME